MSQKSERLRNLLAEELGECRDADLEGRLAELDDLEASMPDRTDEDREALSTLGDDTRHRIARLLVAAEGELCVCELSPLLDVSDSAISHALSDLDDAGLVERRKDGTWHYYRPTERAERLLGALDATRSESA